MGPLPRLFIVSSDPQDLAQPTGRPLPDWQPRPRPQRVTLSGRYCQLVPLVADQHAAALDAAFRGNGRGDGLWTYMGIGPFADAAAYRAYAQAAEALTDPLQFVVIDVARRQPVGTLALMRVDEKNGVIEVGMVTFSDQLKRSPMSTEAQFLLMQYVFDTLGYRRYEWKCDSLNLPSRAAALRLGFQYEGQFRQAVVTKGRNRDTSWFAIIDADWPVLKAAFLAWLEPANFDAGGRQRQSLRELRVARRG